MTGSALNRRQRVLGGGGPMKDQNLEGITGWLAAVAAFQILYVCQHLRQAWALLSREPAWTAFSVGQAAGHLVMPLFVLYCTVLLFRKRRAFPKMFLIQIWLIASVNVIGLALVAAKVRVPHETLIEIGLVAWNVAFAVIGTLYILKSVRVRNTFVT
jgi:hypothetical protein